MDVRMFVNSNVRNAYICVLADILCETLKRVIKLIKFKI